jgi:hypothetical protein
VDLWRSNGPAAQARVVVAGAETNQFGVWIVQSNGEAERLKSRIRIGEDIAELVVVDPLGD